MENLTDQQLETLIAVIMNAEDPGSVTNDMVANALYALHARKSFRLANYKVINDIADLPPDGSPLTGYLLGQMLYLYVGEGGNTLDGKYRSVDLSGVQGKSAYQCYYDTTSDNPKMTEAEWLASLKGDDGVDLGEAAIADNLTTDDPTKVLSAKQGKVLKELIPTVVNDLMTGGEGSALSAEMGKFLALKKGTYFEAKTKSQTHNEPFVWMLDDMIDGIKLQKPIFHIGNNVFVDAVGAVVSNSVKIGASETTTATINGNTITLNEDINEFDIPVISSMSFADNTLITSFDGGGAEFIGTDLNMFSDASNLTYFRGLRSSTITSLTFNNCLNLEELDLSGISEFVYNNSASDEAWFFNCKKLTYLDVSMIDSSTIKRFSTVFKQLTELRTLVIGNLSSAVGSYLGQTFMGTTKVTTLICKETVPPIMKSNIDLIGALVSKSTSLATAGAIKVPSGSLSAYQSATCWDAFANYMIEY